MNLKKKLGTDFKLGRIGKYCVPFLALAFLACPLMNVAQAGPIIEFDDDSLLKIDYKGQFRLSQRDTGFGAADDESAMTMGFRRNRLAFIGSKGDMYGIYVQADYIESGALGTLGVGSPSMYPTDDYFTLIDAQIRIKFNDMLRLRMGKYKASVTRENLEDCYQPLTLDRSRFLAEPFVLSRDTGFTLWGNLLEDKLQYKIDFLEGKPANQDSLSSNLRNSVRVHYSILGTESGYGYRGTYLGKKTVLTIGAAMQSEAEVVTDGGTDTADYSATTVDIFGEFPLSFGTITASAAMVDYSLDDATGAGSSTGLSDQRDGMYIKLGYMLADMPLQFFVRNETWTLANFDGVAEHELTWMGVGLNYYIDGQNSKFTLESSSVSFDDAAATKEDSSDIVFQYQLMF